LSILGLWFKISCQSSFWKACRPIAIDKLYLFEKIGNKLYMNQERRPILAPINPFLPSQRDVLQGVIDGYANKQIAQNLGISIQVVKNHLSGLDASAVINRNETADKSDLGIFGIVEKYCGKRPNNRTNLIAMLTGDVILFKSFAAGEQLAQV